MKNQTLTPIEVTSSWRYETLAAVSTDGQWNYRQISGGPVWAVTHVPTGRRYWTVGLDQARSETADGTAAARLEIGSQPRRGKPMVQGEFAAIRSELSARDLEAMLVYVRPHVAGVVAETLTRIGLPVDYLERYTVSVSCAGKILGAVYSASPDVWVDALRTVRPDLIPPHLERRPAAA